MDTNDANTLRVNAINDLSQIEKRLLTVADVAYKGRDEQKLHEVSYDIQEAFRTLYDAGRELKRALDARWREAGNETRAVYDEIAAQYPGFLHDWYHDLPHYSPLDRQDLLYLLTTTIADIVLHDYDRPEAQDEINVLRGWAKRLEALDTSKE